MGDLMEERLVRQGRDRADRDLSAPLRVTLGVAVQVLKLDSLDFQRLKCLLFVPFRYDGRLVLLAFRLRENEPMRFVGEVSEGEFLFLLGAVFFRDGFVPLASQRHAEGQGLLALLYVPAQFLPLRERRQRSGLDAAFEALEQSEKLVPKAVVVKAAVGFVDVTGLPDGLVQQSRPGNHGFSISSLSAIARAACDALLGRASVTAGLLDLDSFGHDVFSFSALPV